jgi:hypothetical protein
MMDISGSKLAYEKVKDEIAYISTILEARENKPFIFSEFDDRVCFFSGPCEGLIDDHYKISLVICLY